MIKLHENPFIIISNFKKNSKVLSCNTFTKKKNNLGLSIIKYFTKLIRQLPSFVRFYALSRLLGTIIKINKFNICPILFPYLAGAYLSTSYRSILRILDTKEGLFEKIEIQTKINAENIPFSSII